MRLKMLVPLLGLLAPLALPGSASAAAPYSHDHYRGSFSVPNDDEGPVTCTTGPGQDDVVHFSDAGTFHVQDLIKPLPDGSGQAFLLHQNFSFSARTVNLSNDVGFSVRASGLFRELTGVALSEAEAAEYEGAIGPDGTLVDIVGPLYRFTAVEVAHIVIHDDDGRLVSNERGRIAYEIVFDTLGDSQPGGRFVDEEDPVVLSGTNPFFDFCEKALALTT